MHHSQRSRPLSRKRFFRSVVVASVVFSAFFFVFLPSPAAAADAALAGPAPLTALPAPMLSWPLAPIPDDKQLLQSEGPVYAFRSAVGIVEGAAAPSTVDDDGGARAWTGLMGSDGGGGGSREEEEGEGGARRNKGMSIEKMKKKKKKETKRAGMGVGMGVCSSGSSSGQRGSKVYAPMAHDE
ncbi:hypothetical protein DFJ73DRAFT_782844 [Zopfochytrium polystomum]|nr:hypothetical protein DFJ73DRAFT_782844 [Zopfochytrium polystomum]